MSQLIGCRWKGGVLLAADRRVAVERAGEQQLHTVRKLFPLGRRAAVATSGAAVGIMVSRTLSRLLRRRSTLPFAELAVYCLSVFQKEYREFTRQGAAWFAAHPQAHRLSYVLLGGWEYAPGPTLQFYASESHQEPYRQLHTQEVITAPRRLGLEGRLAKAAAQGAGAQDLADLALLGLRTIARQDANVAGPFDLVVLNGDGARWQLDDGNHATGSTDAQALGPGDLGEGGSR